MEIPQTKKENIVDEIHAIKVADPYRWLENTGDIEVKNWIKNQNKYTDSVLRDRSFEIFSKELVENYKVVNFSNPIPVNGKYFYEERQPDEDQLALYVKKGLHGGAVKLFDPNGKRASNTLSIDYWTISSTGKYIVYGISEGGDEMSTLYIKDVDTNKELNEKIPRCRHASVRWLSDESGFFYTRNPREGTVPKNEEHLHLKVYFHKLGNTPEADQLIFGENRPKDDMISLGMSPDGRYVSISVSQSWSENEVYLYDCKTKSVHSLITGIPSIFSIRFLKDKILLDTNYKANNHKVLWAAYDELYKPLEQWKEFIPEKKFLLESIRVTKSKILVEYLVNACSEVCIFDYEGREVEKIPLPEYSTLASISSRREEEEFFYGVNSFLFPKILYHYDPDTLKYSEYKKTDNPINPEEYEVKQGWCVSKDKTRIPLFIYHKKGIKLNGLNPAILYGYGGFNNNQTPLFMRNWVPWIERGGVFAVANIRGGGEFGDEWHKGGIKDNKQNCFDDFIAAAEYLISEKYTDNQHLGILGGSNGGLLVSAVAVQRPDLFKAVNSRVPLTDMVRFPKFGMAIRWVHEYGNPNVKKDLEKILSWSPYHNVKQGIKYPSFLFTTADKDTRVHPSHSHKMAALLQTVDTKNKILVFTDSEAGHGSGKPIVKIVESQALALSFFARELGLKISSSDHLE